MTAALDQPVQERTLARDVERWGRWVLEEARKEIGTFYENPVGEDTIVACDKCSYAANVEQAELEPPTEPGIAGPSKPAPEKVSTPEARTIEEVTSFLDAVNDELFPDFPDPSLRARIERIDVAPPPQLEAGRIAHALRQPRIEELENEVITFPVPESV